MEITREIAEKVLKVVDRGLTDGIGSRRPGYMCVEAAVCYALGEPHSDVPSCVHEGLRRFKIALNDLLWSTKQARAKGLRRIAIAQLGTAPPYRFDTSRFFDDTIRVMVETYLTEAVKITLVRLEEVGETDNAQAIKKALKRLDGGDVNTIRNFSEIAIEASNNIISWSGERFIVKSDPETLGNTCDELLDNWDCGVIADILPISVGTFVDIIYRKQPFHLRKPLVDAAFATFAERVVQILIAMKTPGSAFLDLAPLGE